MSATISLSHNGPVRRRTHGGARGARAVRRPQRVSEATYRRRRAVVGTVLLVLTRLGRIHPHEEPI